MKKFLFLLFAMCLFVLPVAADSDAELKNISDQQLLAVYDAVVAEVQARNLDTSALTVRDSSVVFGENVHVQTGQLSLCLPTAVPETVQLPIAPTATPVVQAGDRAAYDSQTPVDNTHVKAGQIFDITWNMLNTGTTTWTTDYTLRFWTGTNFTKAGKNRWGLLQNTAPNQVGSCVVDAVAPGKPGTYTMSMVLGNENDENFFIVDITIVVD